MWFIINKQSILTGRLTKMAQTNLAACLCFLLVLCGSINNCWSAKCTTMECVRDKLFFRIETRPGQELDQESQKQHFGFVFEGGRFPVSSDDPFVLKVATWAADQLGGKLMTVVKAERQVVAGEIFYLTLKLETENETLSCHANVLTRMWLPSKKMMMLKHVCHHD